MMRRVRNNDVGRRESTVPAPGVGVLLKKLRSRWLVFEPTYSMSNPPPAQSSRWTSKLHCSLRAFGRCRVGEIMSGAAAGPATPVGCSNDNVGLAGSDV